MEAAFIIKNQCQSLKTEEVIHALAGMRPGLIKAHAVEVAGILYPIKDAFAQATGIDRLDFGTVQARRVFERLGFKVIRLPAGASRAQETRQKSR